MTDRRRVVFLDYLRVAACLMVMLIHSAEPFYLDENGTCIASRGDLMWVTVVECLCRACVPLFVMASSYLLFPVSCGTGEFFRRRMKRIVAPFLVWSVVYVVRYGGSWGKMLFNFPDEAGHLWFVPMLLGLYLVMPLLSPWAEKVGERELRGWLWLWLATTTLPFLRRLWAALYGAPSFGATPFVWGECPWNSFGAFHYISGFVGYMLLGLWFRKFAVPRGWRWTLLRALPLWIVGAAMLGLPFFLSVREFPFRAPYEFAVIMETSIEYCSLGVALTTIAAFLVFRKFDFGGPWHEKAVRPAAEASYGAYLVHMLILADVAAAFRSIVPTPLAIVSAAAASFAASTLLSASIRKIPRVGKWICG